MSGTTAIAAFFKGTQFTVANIGDSRAVVGEKKGRRVIAYSLSIDQTYAGLQDYVLTARALLLVAALRALRWAWACVFSCSRAWVRACAGMSAGRIGRTSASA